MKKGTEIKIEIEKDGSWTVSSPDYPGWSSFGEQSINSANDAAESLERWVKSHE